VLFQRRFHAGIADGSITKTFRVWSRPQATVGGRYQVGKVGLLQVDAIEQVTLASISEADVAAAGFESREAMTKYVRRASRKPFDEETTVYAVTFHFDGPDDRPKPDTGGAPTQEAATELSEKLLKMDERHTLGPWTLAVLGLIEEQPGVVSTELANQLGRERQQFKNDVRKLKKLGLTISLETGYKLSPKGEAYLASERDGGTGRG
jgi:hypothetical protein